MNKPQIRRKLLRVNHYLHKISRRLQYISDSLHVGNSGCISNKDWRLFYDVKNSIYEDYESIAYLINQLKTDEEV